MRIGIGIGLQFIKASGLDPATSAFITAFGITDPTQINAINRLVLNYKGQGNLNSSVDLWTNSDAIYPIVGGSASQHTGNLKDPRNLDAAFRLAFSGGWTHDTNGMTGNGVNTFANTFFNSLNNFTTSNSRSFIYSRTNVNETKYDIGAISGSNETAVTTRFIGNFFVNLGSNAAYGLIANADSRGLFGFIRRDASNTLGFKNGINVITHAETEVRPNQNLYLGGINNGGTAAAFSSRNYSFAVFGQAISDTNALLEYQIIQQFQTDLGRNV
jgi:hypothetical protein